MGVFLGIIIGSSFSLSFMLIIKAVSKRKSAEEEKFRILEKQLSVVAEKCDRTHKACCLLSDIVKNNYKTEEKEEYKVPTDKLPHSVAEKVDRFNMTQRILSAEDIMKDAELLSGNYRKWRIEEYEEAQQRILRSMVNGWRSKDDPD